MIKVVGEYAGGRNNDDGETWQKFDIAYTEVPNVAPFLTLVDEKLHIAIDLETIGRKYIGHLFSNAMTRTPKGNVIITLRGRHADVKHSVLDLLVGKSFTIMLLTEAEMNELLAPEESSSHNDLEEMETAHDGEDIDL